ncbi:hypothetical protein QQY66_48630 [Streptomyces sp. DG2A-72]|uniref:hypothetical protein n=1 Tax=Streptomyces sp. DG2A-72 TaxID=3051386 RepID=UPI00265BA9BA|nr:hypothetical protein [Streptomyces sp. DG2A-72]MDO0939186.1 hypothetical protein [Streptomyces sp. DG2A-72]
MAVTEEGATAASVTCGTHIGDVRITAETWSVSPPVDDASWDNVAEASLPWSGDAMTLWGSDTDAGEGDEPEEHLLQVWPAEPGPYRVLKTTDRTGDYWRSR